MDVKTILKCTCDKYHYTVESIKRQGSDQTAAYIRGIAGYIIQSNTKLSLSSLAKLTNRSAPSISRSTGIITKKIQYDRTLDKIIEDIIDDIMKC